MVELKRIQNQTGRHSSGRNGKLAGRNAFESR
jgi:hypothetical protein